MIIRRNFLAAILFILVLYKCYCEDYKLLLCEGQEKNLACSGDATINVISATYGYNASNTEARKECDDWKNRHSPFRDTDNTNCHHPHSADVVADQCNGRSQCTISATNEIFSDPCRGVTKYFELYYNCTKDEGESELTTETHIMSGEERGDGNSDEGRGGRDRESYSSNVNSESPDNRVLMTTGGYELNSGSNDETYSNSDGIQIEKESKEGNDNDNDDHNDDDNDNNHDEHDDSDDGDGDDDGDVDGDVDGDGDGDGNGDGDGDDHGDGDSNGDDNDDDDKDGKGPSAVAVVAIAAGIPIGVVIIISTIVILACILASQIKRRKTLAATNDRNLSVDQYDGQGLPMTASSNNEDSEMVYNSAYQSVPQDGQSAVKTTGNGNKDDMRINYENLSEVESTNERTNTNDEEAVYNEAYQSINGNEPKR